MNYDPRHIAGTQSLPEGATIPWPSYTKALDYELELGIVIAHAVREDGVMQPLKGLHLARASRPLEKLHSVMEPSLCVIAQGSKEVLLGNNRYQYDPFHYLLATLELPLLTEQKAA